MKRLAILAVAAGILLVAILGTGRAVFATPFADIPANHWAYQYLQTLAADGVVDGYPDGKFKGDRPLTRYEMAVVVARAVAHVQETGASKQDLEKLQKLIDALKDELDALGVRVTNLEDSLDALDKRTKFAQALEFHGNLNAQYSQRDRTQQTLSIVNGTEQTVTTYYGQTVGVGKQVTVDPFVQAFLTTDDTNNPFTQAGPGILMRTDDLFSLIYHYNENLTISFPTHILNYNYGAQFLQGGAINVEPGIAITVLKTGAIQNLKVKYGMIDDMTASRTGLTFKPPTGDQNPLYFQALQPWPIGFEVSGTVNGLTDVQLSLTRVAPTEYNTQPYIFDQNAPTTSNPYLDPTVPPQISYTQALPPGAGAYQTASYNSGTTTLAEVFLPAKAQIGSVYISQYDGATFDANGNRTGGPAITPPAATYNEAYNAVIFNPPIPAGSSVTISFRPLGNTFNSQYQRYMINARINQKIKGDPGAEVGLSFNRVFDYDQPVSSGAVYSAYLQQPVQGYGAVSDTVLGLDFNAPVRVTIDRKRYEPIIFGEVAAAKYTPDYHNVSAVTDTAGIVGLKLKVQQVDLSLQYQSVGPGFLDGAPYRYYGPPPALFAYYQGSYLPDFFGFANNLGINQEFDTQFLSGGAFFSTALNPNLTYLSPVFNPFRGSGPTFFQAYTPNTAGISFSGNTPIRVGSLSVKGTVQYSYLQEIRPNSPSSIEYGPGYASNVRENFNTLTLGASTSLPAFGQKVAISLNGTWERLSRNDQTKFQYYPFNPGTQTFDPAAYANAIANVPGQGVTYPFGSQVSFYPNFVNMQHYVYNARVSLPLTSGVALDLAYTGQNYSGESGTTLTQNIAQKKNYYIGSLNYTIPRTNSTLGFQYRTYQYLDNVLPSYNYTENRADLNFTIRF